MAEKLTKAQNDVKQGTFVEPTRLTVGEWLDTWLNEYKRPKVRPSTLENYEIMIRAHIKPAIGGVQLRQLQPSDVQRFYNAKLEAGRTDGRGGLSPRMVRYMHGALKQAVKEGLVVRNVTEAVEPRHTYATLLLEAGEHPKVVQELLGHSNISITLDTYSHVMPELKQAAAARLNGLFAKKRSPPQWKGTNPTNSITTGDGAPGGYFFIQGWL